jgi:hypothetical protein
MDIPQLDRVLCGDCRELLHDLPDECVDLCFTDPPYERAALPLFEWLAMEVPRVLKPGASLITLFGHLYLPEILRMFDGRLKYRWILCMDQTVGNRAKLKMGIEVAWKPALWFVKGHFPAERFGRRGWVADAVAMPASGAGTTKRRHKWEQSKQWSDYYMERLTLPGDVVLDPVCGSGVFLLSAQERGCHYVGYEMCDEYAAEASKWLGEST